MNNEAKNFKLLFSAMFPNITDIVGLKAFHTLCGNHAKDSNTSIISNEGNPFAVTTYTFNDDSKLMCTDELVFATSK